LLLPRYLHLQAHQVLPRRHIQALRRVSHREQFPVALIPLREQRWV
jgi:hypothetical protein